MDHIKDQRTELISTTLILVAGGSYPLLVGLWGHVPCTFLNSALLREGRTGDKERGEKQDPGAYPEIWIRGGA